MSNVLRTVSNQFPGLVEALREIAVIMIYNIKRGNSNFCVLVIYLVPGRNGLSSIHTHLW